MKTAAAAAVLTISLMTGCRTTPPAIERPAIVLEIEKQEHRPAVARAQIIFGNNH